MKRTMLTALGIAGLLLAACGGETKDPGPKSIPRSNDDDGAYETSVYNEARSEWEPLAEQGDAMAQKNLGVMYYLGQGLDPNYDEAFRWFTKAAQQGDDVAQLSLGVMYTEGQGVAQDNVKSLMWLTLSADQGNTSAKHRMSEVMRKMSRDEITEAKDLAKNWNAGS